MLPFDASSQANELRLEKERMFIMEKLSVSEAVERKIEKIKSTLANNLISSNWNAEDFRTQDEQLDPDYKTIRKGLLQKGMRFKELNQSDFSKHLMEDTEGDVFYLMLLYEVKEENNMLMITRTFIVLTADTILLVNESASGLLRQIKVSH